MEEKENKKEEAKNAKKVSENKDAKKETNKEIKKEVKKEAKKEATKDKKKESKKEEKEIKKVENKKAEEKKIEKVKEKKVENPPVVKAEVQQQEQPQVKAEVKEQTKTDTKPKFQKVESGKKKKGKKGIAIFILLALIIAGVAAAWMCIPEFRNLFSGNNNSSISEEDKKMEEASAWEKAYVNILMDEKNDYANMTGCRIQLITIDEEDKVPALVVNYSDRSRTAEKVVDIWQADENGEIIAKIEKLSASDDSVIILYDVDNEKYNWYLYYKDREQESYGILSRILKEAKDTTRNDKKVDTDKNTFDYVISTKATKSSIAKDKFEQKFIQVDSSELSKTWVSYKENPSKIETLDILKNESKKKTVAREVVKDDAKEDILDRAETILKKQKLAKTEVTVGKHTLKYGTYKAKKETKEAEVVLLADKTCAYIGSAPDESEKQINTLGTYIFVNTDSETDNVLEITLSDGTKLQFVVGDNKFSNNVLEFNFENSNTVITNIPNVNTTITDDIGKDEALKLAQKLFGTESDGKKMGYYYLAWVKDRQGNKFYAYRVSWLVDESHYSFVNTVLISADGKSYKEIGTPEDFTDGQVVNKFDSEKSF